METKKRVFVAVKLPESVEAALEQNLASFSDLPIRLLDKKLWHITVAFLGYINRSEEAALAEMLAECLESHTAFEFNIDSIDWGPPDTTPRMIWANVSVSSEYIDLVRSLKQRLQEKQAEGMFKQYKSRKEQFKTVGSHITLARFRAEDWGTVKNAFQKQHLVMQKLKIPFAADVVYIMQSMPKRTGTEYAELASFKLGMSRIFNKP